MESAVLDKNPVEVESLYICSIEDEPEAIAGSLSSLEFDGHRIKRCSDLHSAKRVLLEYDIDLILLDEHVDGDDDAGTKLVAELKAGQLGTRNEHVPFGFVTGSRKWVSEKLVSGYPGYLGIEIKGGTLTRTLEEWVQRVLFSSNGEGISNLRRIPLYMEEIESAEGEPMNVILSIPAWDLEKTLAYPVAELPVPMQETLDQQVEQWFIARVSLYEHEPKRMMIRDWEQQEPLEDDDGLA